MLNLTFAEQVKIILGRKGMTIKELAEIIEEKTGKKMSRQNLTQRLGRDNFQEQDMRMIADILGCSFQLSIMEDLGTEEKSNAPDKSEISLSDKEMEKISLRRARNASPAVTKEQEVSEETTERDITMGELISMMSDTEQEIDQLMEESEQRAEQQKHKERRPMGSVIKEYIKNPLGRNKEKLETVEAEPQAAELNFAYKPQAEELNHASAPQSGPVFTEDIQAEAGIAAPEAAKPAAGYERMTGMEEPEDPARGEINPYSGHEYQSNSVRIHPKRIGYVQVYDRSEHKWTDMTEWAFLGYQERKKALLGNDYEPPIYLD